MASTHERGWARHAVHTHAARSTRHAARGTPHAARHWPHAARRRMRYTCQHKLPRANAPRRGARQHFERGECPLGDARCRCGCRCEVRRQTLLCIVLRLPARAVARHAPLRVRQLRPTVPKMSQNSQMNTGSKVKRCDFPCMFENCNLKLLRPEIWYQNAPEVPGWDVIRLISFDQLYLELVAVVGIPTRFPTYMSTGVNRG